MRRRELVREFWRVRWPDVDGGTHNFDGDEREDVESELAAIRREYGTAAKLYRVRVYRLAPLVMLPAWSVRRSGAHIGKMRREETWAHVSRDHDGWSFELWTDNTGLNGYCHRTKRAAIAAAEEALRMLGYGVRK